MDWKRRLTSCPFPFTFGAQNPWETDTVLPHARRRTIPTIYLIRHGETDWNQDKRIQGQIDVPMNARGRRQAEALAERLSSIHFDIVFTSDLSRAKETADIIAAGQAREVPIVAMTELRELDYGQWEGLTRLEVSVQFADAWSAWNQGGRVGRPTGGEDSLSLLGRAGRAFDRAVKEGKTVLISTHRVTLRTLLCYALGLELTLRSRFAVRNCALSALECHPGYRPRILFLNDTCHLDHQGL